jgi:NAD(P)H-hydrate repair Nnr-like enzyme with NAD(P)H-hydrate dehydratase domain
LFVCFNIHIDFFLCCRDSISAGQEIGSWIQRIHVLVIGPGLGREEKILGNTKVRAEIVTIPVSK